MATPTPGATTATAEARPTGRLHTGTSGFAYPAWAPRFYPPGLKADGLLRHYATRLTAVELNNTFYQQPSPSKVAAWLEATPPGFRFSVKAQRGGSYRSMTGQPEPGLPVAHRTVPGVRGRLGTVLFRVPDGLRRDDDRLAALLAAWPRDLPLTLEFQDPSWAVDETIAALTAAGAALCSTDLPDDPEPPTIRRTGPFLYLRLRRHDYTPGDLDAWVRRLAPFIEAGDDAFVFFRHDEVGRGAELALELADAWAAYGLTRANPPPARTPRG